MERHVPSFRTHNGTRPRRRITDASLGRDAEILGDAAEHRGFELAVAQQHLLGQEHAEAAVLTAKRTAVDAARAACLQRPQLEQHPLVGADRFVEPQAVIDARAAGGEAGDVDLPEAGTEVGDVRNRARVHERIVGKRRRRAHPQANRSAEPDRRRCASASLLGPRRGTATGAREASTDRTPPRVGTASKVALSSRAWNDATIEKMTSPSWTARTWRAENDPPSRSRSTWRITGRSTRPGREEVAVQRVRQPLGRHRRARGAQRLRRDLAAVERHARARALLVLAAEQVTVEDFEVEQRRETALLLHLPGSTARSLPSVTCPAPRTIISVTAETKEEPCCSPA